MTDKVGKLCIKIAGRDAGQACIIVEDLGKGLVLIDGATRRRKCNINHLEILEKSFDIKKGASHEDVVKELKLIGVEVTERKTKAKKAEKATPVKEAKKKPATKKAKK
jgi:large subunit ribosomal protein L14e